MELDWRNVNWKRIFGVWTVLLISLLLAWVAYFSIDREYVDETELGHGFRVVERMHVDRRAYLAIAEAGDFLWLPIPSAGEYMVQQSLYKNQSLVLDIAPLHEGERVFHVSDNGNLVLVEDALHNKPWEIIETHSGQTATVPAPREEIHGHYYGYPFSFLRWSGDIPYIHATVDGTFVDDTRGFLAFRELWQIDPFTGESRRLQRCTQARSEVNTWEGSPCQ